MKTKCEACKKMLEELKTKIVEDKEYSHDGLRYLRLCKECDDKFNRGEITLETLKRKSL